MDQRCREIPENRVPVAAGDVKSSTRITMPHVLHQTNFLRSPVALV
jgi:hypothetical protein